MESTATKTSSPSKSDVSPTKSSDEAAAAAESPGKASSSDKQGDANTSSSSSSPNKSSGVIAPASSPIKSDESSSPNKPGEDPGVGGENASPTKEEIKKNVSKAMQHLYAGKRNMLVKDYNNAVTELAESSRLLGETYGETAVECAEAYYHYGKALLELARLESGVLGTAVQEESEKSDDEESDEDNEASEEKNDTEDQEMKEVEDQAEEGKEEKTPEIKGKEKAKDKEEEETKDKEEEAKDKEEEAKDKEEESKDEGSGGKEKDNESIGSNEAGTSELKDTHDKREIDNEDVEDPSNLQLSWEMLELAKSLFQKHADSLEAEDSKRMDLESKLSETYQILGEVSIENENYEQACEDLTCCLRRRQELLPEDSRCIAETHYQLGVALGFNLEFDKAIGALNDAIFVLNKRISLLKEKKESPDPAVTNDAFYSREREVKEIESLIPEIHEKIADTKDMQQETFKKLGDKALMEEDEIEAVSPTKQNGPGKSNGDSGKGDSKPTSDISHMIKKRKKSSTPVNGVEEPAPKKQNL